MDTEKNAKELSDKEMDRVSGGAGWNTPFEYVINPEMCICCRSCEGCCPMDCIRFENEFAVINQEFCIQCGNCAGVCPTDAIIKK